jgi:hypothetical protein
MSVLSIKTEIYILVPPRICAARPLLARGYEPCLDQNGYYAPRCQLVTIQCPQISRTLRAPPGYLKPNDQGKVLKLLRSLYGLKQAGFEWSEELASAFAKMGFSRSQIDQAVYYYRRTDKHMVITISVDDMAVTSKY